MGFVVQMPHSNTNPSDRYRVAHSDDLMRYINGATRRYAFTAFDTFEAAEAAKNLANAEARKRSAYTR